MTSLTMARAMRTADLFVKHCRKHGVALADYRREWERWAYTQRIPEDQWNQLYGWVDDYVKSRPDAQTDRETLDLFRRDP